MQLYVTKETDEEIKTKRDAFSLVSDVDIEEPMFF